MCIYSNTSDGQNSLRVSSNSAIRLNFEWNPTLLVFVCLFVSLNLNQVNSSRPLYGPRTTFWKPLFERASHSPSGPWPSLPHPNPTDEPAKLQLLCVGIYARLQLAETPSAQQIIGPNHCCASGFNTCHMRLYIRKSPAIAADKRVQFATLQTDIGLCRPANAATVQLSVRWASQIAPTPPLCDWQHHPLPAMQWRYSGSSYVQTFLVAIPLRAGFLRARNRNVIFDSFCKQTIRISRKFPLWITVYVCGASSEAGAMNVSLTLLFL